MSTLASAIETIVRQRLVESSAAFWTSSELISIMDLGHKDLWRDTVDLKQEHYLTVNDSDVSLSASTSTLTGVPSDVHKGYLIEPRDVSSGSANAGLIFTPLDFNHVSFRMARTLDAVDPANANIYYAITGQGAPVNAPIIRVAPQVTSQVLLTFSYIPTVSTLASTSPILIPGEADAALVAWTVAFALAKEREDKSPDPNWLAVYATEKQHLLQSLGLRQYQEPQYADALFEHFW